MGVAVDDDAAVQIEDGGPSFGEAQGLGHYRFGARAAEPVPHPMDEPCQLRRLLLLRVHRRSRRPWDRPCLRKGEAEILDRRFRGHAELVHRRTQLLQQHRLALSIMGEKICIAATVCVSQRPRLVVEAGVRDGEFENRLAAVADAHP